MSEDPSNVFMFDNSDPEMQRAYEALAGNAGTVQVLIEAGADRNALTSNGLTPLALAQSLGWRKVVELLSKTA